MNIPKFMGFRRENGRVGVRNHIIVLPLDDLSNAACEAVANNIKGIMAIPHPYGRLQFGEDLELFFRTIIGTGVNPNVAAVVVIGIEPEWTNRIVDEIAETGKPVKGFSIERSGDLNTIAQASRQAKEYVQRASELQRTECSMDELYVSVKCGESDTTSGLASNPTVGNVIDRLVEMKATVSFGETSEIKCFIILRHSIFLVRHSIFKYLPNTISQLSPPSMPPPRREDLWVIVSVKEEGIC